MRNQETIKTTIMPDSTPVADIQTLLATSMEESHIRARLALEGRHHQHVIRWHRKFLHVENWYSVHGMIRFCLSAVGLHNRGQKNTRKIRLTNNAITHKRIPAPFNNYRILHLSDLHLDMDCETTHAIIEKVRNVDYDLCVMTGDYRANTFGDSQRAMELMAELRNQLPDPVIAILGNHDSVQMVPPMEKLGITMLMNRSVRIEKDNTSIVIAGVDDAHYFHLDDVAKAAMDISTDDFSILLSHTPELFERAGNAGFDVFFCGHTHGGQICLPGGIPIILEAKCPRSLGKGPWQYQQMLGYTSVGASTSVVNVRLNCPPEITLHTLRCED